jgi:hypothetical protein
VTRDIVDVGSRRYTVSFDAELPRGRRTTVIVRCRALDELTGLPVPAPLAVAPGGAAFERPATRALVRPRTADGALTGLVGVPVTVLPLFTTQAYEVGLRVSAPGYNALAATRPHGPFAGGVDAWQPCDLGDLHLHREAIEIEGRVVAAGPPAAPVNNATVSVALAWRAPATPLATPAPTSSRLLNLTPGIYARRAAAATQVEGVMLTSAGGTPKRLLGGVPAGVTDVRLSDAAGLAVGTLLRIDGADPDRAEVIPIDRLDGATTPSPTPTLPVVATLAHPLAGPHRDGAAAEALTEAVGATHVLDIDAEPRDRCLLLGTVGQLGTTNQWARVADGVSPPEYHRPARIRAVTGGDGFFRLPAVDRVVSVRLRATAAGLAPAERDLALDVGVSRRSIDFVLS